MTWISDIIIAILALMGTLGGAYFSNRRSSALVVYRLEQLEKKVDKHNTLVERMYALEKRLELLKLRLDEGCGNGRAEGAPAGPARERRTK